MPQAKRVTIWRIENEVGRGMYACCAYEKVFREDTDSSAGQNHPTPQSDPKLGWNDMLGYEQDKYYFGFASLAQMRQWVHLPKWRRGLEKMGLRLNKYSVPAESFRRSPFQAIFKMHEAVLVESRSPDYADRKIAGYNAK